MPYNEALADRVRIFLKRRRIAQEEKRMMGGICFMVNDKICVGVDRDRLLARVGDLNYESALKKKGVKKMDITGRPLRGFVLVGKNAIDTEDELEYWINLCLEFNPYARASTGRQKS